METSNALKPYQIVDETTGEVKSQIKYMEGRPKQYRFDAKFGKFNINGNEPVGDTLSFQPIAWRIFVDNILNLGTKNWAEIFFVDDKHCLSSILFHGFSIDNLYRLIEPLYYEGLTLADVKVKVTVERKENTKITPKGTYYIAQFAYEKVDEANTKMYAAFVSDHQIYRAETLTDTAEVKLIEGYGLPHAEEDTRLLGAGNAEAA